MQVINGRGIIIATKDTSASHTFSISRLVTEVVKIDEKYLPDTVATKSEVRGAQSTATSAQITANGARAIANEAKNKATNAQTIAENSKIDPNSYNYGATLFSKGGKFIGWYEAMPKLGYNETLGSFYRSPFETTPLKCEDIPSDNFICIADLVQGGVSFGRYILFLTKQLTNSGNSWKVAGVAIHEQGYMFYVESAVVGKSTGEGLFLDFLPQKYILINSSTAGSTKKFKITVDDSGTLKATEATE